MILEMKIGLKAQGFMHSKIIRFKEGVNLLVGPNGAGKSCVLANIMSKAKETSKERGKSIKVKGVVETRYYDTEYMNPRTRDAAEAMGSFELMQLRFSSKSMSHGQALGPIVGKMMDGTIKSTLEKMKRRRKLVMLLDEPEAGLDQTALATFADVVNKWKAKVQFIIATHSVWLWCNLGGHFIVLGEDKKYVKNTMNSWRRMLLVESQI
jgi:energy-coupling factor transporter ATP-binding protein EcfA2